MTKRERGESIAARISLILGVIDDFEDDDIELLKELKSQIESNMSYNASVSIVAMACGGKNYNQTIDEAKVKELEHIIGLTEARQILRDEAEAELRIPDGNSFYR